MNSLPRREVPLRTRRPGAPNLGAAILPRAGSESPARWRATRGGGARGGLCWSRGRAACRSRGQCALSAAAPAGSCSWSGGVWSRRGECVGKPGWGWEMPVPQRFPRGPALRSCRALPWAPCLAWGRDPTQKHFPAPAPFRREAGETPAPQPSSASVSSLLATGSSAGPQRDAPCVPFYFLAVRPPGDPRISRIPTSHLATANPFVWRCL